MFVVKIYSSKLANIGKKNETIGALKQEYKHVNKLIILKYVIFFGIKSLDYLTKDIQYVIFN